MLYGGACTPPSFWSINFKGFQEKRYSNLGPAPPLAVIGGQFLGPLTQLQVAGSKYLRFIKSKTPVNCGMVAHAIHPVFGQ